MQLVPALFILFLYRSEGKIVAQKILAKIL